MLSTVQEKKCLSYSPFQIGKEETGKMDLKITRYHVVWSRAYSSGCKIHFYCALQHVTIFLAHFSLRGSDCKCFRDILN